MRGARNRNVFGTYLHGPLLPKNPELCDYLISLALKKKYDCDIPLLKLNDDIELLCIRTGLRLSIKIV